MRKLFIVFVSASIFMGLMSCNRTAKQVVKLEMACQDSICVYNDSVENIRIQDSIKREREKLRREVQSRQLAIEDSLKYLAEPFIDAHEAASLKPVLKKWLNFHKLNLSCFKLETKDSLNVDYLLSMDTASIYYHPFNDDYHKKYTPQNRDYSPDKQRYINVLETSCVYQDEDDGKWYYDGSDDCQELRLVDLKRRIDHMFMFTGTSFVDAAFWKNNDCFVIVKHEYWDESYMIIVYDLKNKIYTRYRLKAPSPERNYLQYDMKTRDVIIK